MPPRSFLAPPPPIVVRGTKLEFDPDFLFWLYQRVGGRTLGMWHPETIRDLVMPQVDWQQKRDNMQFDLVELMHTFINLHKDVCYGIIMYAIGGNRFLPKSPLCARSENLAWRDIFKTLNAGVLALFAGWDNTEDDVQSEVKFWVKLDEVVKTAALNDKKIVLLHNSRCVRWREQPVQFQR